MNAGLVVGYVRNRSGRTVSGAQVWISNLQGMAGGNIVATGDNDVRPGSPITETNSDGYFELAFAWSGTEIATVIGGGGRTRMYIAAMETVWQNSSSNISYMSSGQTIVGYLMKDVLGMAGLTPPDLKSKEGLIEFTKDILDSAANLKGHPIFKRNMLTTESWLILSAANLFINKY